MDKFSGEEHDDTICIKISDVWIFNTENLRENEIKERFFKNLNFYKRRKETIDIELEFEKYLCLKEKFSDFLKTEKLLSYYLLDMSLEKFVTFFERSNSKGVVLNFIDILSAKLYTGNFNLKEKIKSFATPYKLEPELIVRTIAYLKSLKAKNNAEKEGIKIDKEFILTQLTADDFHEQWDCISNLYKKTLDYLYNNYFIISQDWMPYTNMLIPLIVFIMELKDYGQMNDKQQSFIIFWYWSAIFSNRYTGSSNEVIIEDANLFLRIAKDKGFENSDYLNKISKLKITSIEDLFYIIRRNALYSGILNLINFENKSLLNWNNTNKLHFNSKLEDHHIFPKNYLEKKVKNIKYNPNCVVNRTLITKIDNLKISDSPPSIYFAKMKEINKNIDKCLKTHLIDPNIISNNNNITYDTFIEERANQIFQLIKKYTVDLYDNIKNEFIVKYAEKYEQIISKSNNDVKIFCRYKGQKREAIFNVQTKQINYKEKLLAPSRVAKIVMQEIDEKHHSTANGWTFWKYLDKNNEEKAIDELRK